MASNGTIRELTQKETWSVQQAWRVVFARRLHRLTGRWSCGRHLDLFRPNFVLKYLKGAEAEAEYASTERCHLYVIRDEGTGGELRECSDEGKPTLAELIGNSGALVCPTDLTWTLVTGPDYWDPVCFTYREWVDDVESPDDGPVP